MSGTPGLEWNKIAASLLLAGLIAMIVGIATDAIYEPELKPEKRGFQVAVTETPDSAAPAAAPEKPVDLAGLMSTASAESGAESAKKCQACHDLTKGGPNKVGPNLWGVVGRPKGTHEGYSYSDAMKAKGGNWTYEDLYHFINSPRKFVPGTKMGFAGIAKPQEIANVLAYLRTLSDNPLPVPAKK